MSLTIRQNKLNIPIKIRPIFAWFLSLFIAAVDLRNIPSSTGLKMLPRVYKQTLPRLLLSVTYICMKLV